MRLARVRRAEVRDHRLRLGAPLGQPDGQLGDRLAPRLPRAMPVAAARPLLSLVSSGGHSATVAARAARALRLTCRDVAAAGDRGDGARLRGGVAETRGERDHGADGLHRGRAARRREDVRPRRAEPGRRDGEAARGGDACGRALRRCGADRPSRAAGGVPRSRRGCSGSGCRSRSRRTRRRRSACSVRSRWPEALVLAVVLAPTDAALGQAVVTLPGLPSPIRQGLNVESGLERRPLRAGLRDRGRGRIDRGRADRRSTVR